MLLFKVVKKSTLLFYLTLAILVLLCSLILILDSENSMALINIQKNEDWDAIISSIFSLRNQYVFNNDTDRLKSLFLTEERNGCWAYENETLRIQYIDDWSSKQGVDFIGINSTIHIRSIKQVGRGYAFYVIASTEYRYVYKDDPQQENMFRLGTYHSIDLIPGTAPDSWIISREWYDDPLSDAIKLGDETSDITAFIASQTLPDLSGLSAERLAAVEYADMFCGAASDGQTEYQYNKDYTNFNSEGGDCANFASQILHEGGGFKKNKAWNYRNGKGSRAWVNAQGFKDYWLYSGNASLIAKGKYNEVYQSAYSLRPGDIIAYAKKGKVSHISVVTGLDSKGYPLVSCHNADRFHVPWDIGWSRSNITFFLISVHY